MEKNKDVNYKKEYKKVSITLILFSLFVLGVFIFILGNPPYTYSVGRSMCPVRGDISILGKDYSVEDYDFKVGDDVSYIKFYYDYDKNKRVYMNIDHRITKKIGILYDDNNVYYEICGVNTYAQLCEIVSSSQIISKIDSNYDLKGC